MLVHYWIIAVVRKLSSSDNCLERQQCSAVPLAAVVHGVDAAANTDERCCS